MDSLRALKPYGVRFCLTQYSVGHAAIFAQSRQAALELAEQMSSEDIDDLESSDSELSVEDVELLEETETEKHENE